MIQPPRTSLNLRSVPPPKQATKTAHLRPANAVNPLPLSCTLPLLGLLGRQLALPRALRECDSGGKRRQPLALVSESCTDRALRECDSWRTAATAASACSATAVSALRERDSRGTAAIAASACSATAVSALRERDSRGTAANP